MIQSQCFLIAGGVMSALISLLHVALVVEPSLFRYLSAGIVSGLAAAAERGSAPTTVVTAALAVTFAIWAICALSGAGLIVRLPLLRPALVAIFVIYILRALTIPTEIRMVMNQGYPFRFVLFSAISLVAGVLYLVGFLKSRVPS